MRDNLHVKDATQLFFYFVPIGVGTYLHSVVVQFTVLFSSIPHSLVILKKKMWRNADEQLQTYKKFVQSFGGSYLAAPCSFCIDWELDKYSELSHDLLHLLLIGARCSILLQV